MVSLNLISALSSYVRTLVLSGNKRFYLDSTQTKIKRKYAFYNPTSIHKQRIKRRSASSSSSNSSFNSNLTQTSQYVDHLQATSNTNCMILNDASNKFDIDNIVIPYDMLCGSSSSKIAFIQKQDIQTPSWRASDICLANEQVPNDLDKIEDLTDDYYRKLHELNELKERYYTVFKKLEKEKIKKQANDPALQDASTSARERLSSLCLDEFKNLVNKLENEHNRRKLNGQYKHFNNFINQSLSASTSNSLLMFKRDSGK
jgi:hypothetical protein